MPLLPASWFSYSSLTLCPSGVTAPIPVMTTRFRIAISLTPGLHLFPFAAHDRGTLTHVGIADLDEIRLGNRPGLCQHLHGAGGIGRFVIQRGRQDPVLHGKQTGGEVG